MYEFLKGHKTTATPPRQDIEPLTQQLVASVKAQHAAGNITAGNLQKIVALVNDTNRLKNAMRFL